MPQDISGERALCGYRISRASRLQRGSAKLSLLRFRREDVVEVPYEATTRCDLGARTALTYADTASLNNCWPAGKPMPETPGIEPPFSTRAANRLQHTRFTTSVITNEQPGFLLQR